MTHTQVPRLAVIGGSGLYSFIDDADQIDVATPYGPPSGPITVGQVDGRPVAFLPRHGPHHELPPHKIGYRANIWALRSLGVRQILAPCAVGGLTADVAPGDMVVPDQLVDRTTSRTQTFMDSGAVHAPFADPYCPTLRRALLTVEPSATDGGTMVVIEGPRFSTRAESRSYAAAGWSLVNMTGHPEAVLARELGVCYAALALVTDMDAGVDNHDSVDQATVFAEFARNTDRVRDVLRRAIGALDERTDEPTDCACASWLDAVTLPFTLP
ncbi:S-methyl-5'-thioadenosine phosphorylase [Sanguibacter antarcticus]|uniref:Purine nucleoside phosphorylase n=1 Tax=Sanguibacter antarcticus TaxID=372484 RepID=A0A2A9E5F7_9MICO|nr:S-methyl-5'-thioadenosine phosphorylase [Sanguibacter antarcticus]PFG34287.1 methylthioadenosine phosphorylase [Sanguibacter antarcticus]